MNNRCTSIGISSAFILIVAVVLLGLRGSDTPAFKKSSILKASETHNKRPTDTSALKNLPPIRTSQAHSKWLTDTLMQSPAKADVSYQDKIRLVADAFDRANVLTMRSFSRGQLVFGGYTDGAYNDFGAYLQCQRIDDSFVNSKEILTYQKAVPENPNNTSYISWCSLFDPQFSPNKKYILFKFGHIFQPNYFHVYVYDLQTHRSYLTEKETITYDAISWSPDSKYIALAKAGGDDPRSSNPRIPYEVSVINWRTGKNYPVVKSTSIEGPWSWIAPHTLIYGSLPADIDHSLKHIDVTDPRVWQRLTHDGKRSVQPNIYRYSVGDAKPELTVKNGFLPAVSPDAKYIAYFQLSNPQNITKFPGGDASYSVNAKLVVAPLNKSTFSIGKPVVLHQYAAPCPQLVWTNDGHLLVLHEKEYPSKHYSLDIDKWNIQHKSSRHLTTLTAANGDWEKGFQTIFLSPTLSPDGRKLMLTVNDYYPISHGGVSPMDTLKELDLQTGNVTTVAVIKPSLGSAWSYTLPNEQ